MNTGTWARARRLARTHRPSRPRHGKLPNRQPPRHAADPHHIETNHTYTTKTKRPSSAHDSPALSSNAVRHSHTPPTRQRHNKPTAHRPRNRSTPHNPTASQGVALRSGTRHPSRRRGPGLALLRPGCPGPPSIGDVIVLSLGGSAPPGFPPERPLGRIPSPSGAAAAILAHRARLFPRAASATCQPIAPRLCFAGTVSQAPIPRAGREHLVTLHSSAAPRKLDHCGNGDQLRSAT